MAFKRAVLKVTFVLVCIDAVSSFEIFRSNLRKTYASRITQSITATFIVLNFTFEIIVSQRHKPVPDEYEEWVSGIVEVRAVHVHSYRP